MATRMQKAPRATGIVKPISENRPFNFKFKGQVIHLSTDDVSAMAEQILYQAMLPCKNVNTVRTYDPATGKIIGLTRTTENTPGDPYAAAAWLLVEALRGK